MKEDVFASLREMEWDATVPEEDKIYEPDTWFTKLPRCKWKTKRYWWNNGVEQTLQEKCPPGYVKGRLWTKEHKESFKAKAGSGCGIYDRTRFKKINTTQDQEAR